MIFRELTLRPFAGIAHRTITFRDRLNIILGPNETGKSTIFRALLSALFLPVTARKNSKEWLEIAEVLPVDGDTARVSLSFVHNRKEYLLEKTWGASPAAALYLPGNGIVTDQESIAHRIRDLLPAPEATCRSILLADQGGLPDTLKRIENDKVTAGSLGTLLRSALQETDGISVEAFKGKLQESFHNVLSRWDIPGQCPENNRGIGNPYKKDVGELLKAFYVREQLRKDLRDVAQYEEERDRLVADIARISAERRSKKDFLEQNRPVLEAARERRTLTAELDAHRARLAALQKDNQAWPVAETQRERLETDRPALEQKIMSLKEEQRSAEQSQAEEELRVKLAKATPIAAALEQAQNALTKLAPLSSEQLDTLCEAAQNLSRLEASIKAGKLTMEIQSRGSTSLEIARDLSTRETAEVSSGSAMVIEAGRHIELVHPDLTITVYSGDSRDIASLHQEVTTAREQLQSLCATYNVGSVDQARERHLAFKATTDEVKKHQSALDLVLEGTDLTTLREDVAARGPTTPQRTVADIVKELSDTEYQLRENRKSIQETTSTIQRLSQQYTDPMSLLLQVAQTAQKEKELTAAISSLTPLPADCPDAASFLQRFAEIETQWQGLERDYGERTRELARMDGAEPEASSEELAIALEEAQERFRAVNTRAQALVRIKEVTESILSESDTGAFSQLEDRLRVATSAMTHGAYEEIAMEDALLRRVVRPDGSSLDYDLLSGGTKDAVALAVRLTMAGYFLKASEGFLLLDDPLINMDPTRREAAAKLLSAFGTNTQLMLFTCHPSHAALFSDHHTIKFTDH